ncbi:MAG: hypothetical protein AAB729_00210 [Patescibacteria group bacterium]
MNGKTSVELKLGWARPGDFMKFWNWLKKAENAVTWYFAHTKGISDIWASRDGCEVTCSFSEDKIVFSVHDHNLMVEVEVGLDPALVRPKCLITTTDHRLPVDCAVLRHLAVIENGHLLVTGLAGQGS